MIRIGIVDDHQIVIDGLISLLNHQKELNIVCTANSGAVMLDMLKENKIDILLTDIMMPEMSGLEFSTFVKQLFPEIKIIALSMNGEGLIIEQMIEQASIVGYLLKQTNSKELVKAIQHIYHGGIYFPDAILAALETQSKVKKNVETANLTIREKEVIGLMEKDLSNKQISEKLCISVRTVETHRKNIFRKTGANNLLSLVKWAYEHKIL